MTETSDTLDNIHPSLRALAVPISELNEDPNNVNLHGDKSLEAIAGAFIEFGQRKNKCRPANVAHESKHVPQGGGGCLSKKQAGAEVDGYNTAPGMAYPGNVIDTTGSSGGHPAAFPIGLPTFFIKAYSDPGDVIFDPFVGSGTVIIASEREGRRGYGCEISRGYCDVTVQRWETETGKQATRIPAPDKAVHRPDSRDLSNE